MQIKDIVKSPERISIFDAVLEEACRQWCCFIDESPERKDGEGFANFFYEIFADKEREYLENAAALPSYAICGACGIRFKVCAEDVYTDKIRNTSETSEAESKGYVTVEAESKGYVTVRRKCRCLSCGQELLIDSKKVEI